LKPQELKEESSSYRTLFLCLDRAGHYKASLYLASSVQTICVHTRCLSMGKLESRFMAAALGSRYETGDTDKENRHYTGRHWWGRNQAEVVEPILGKEADDLAMQLGLPKFVADERGTTILILLPVLGELSLLETLNLAGTQLLWNCWPKMLKTGQDKRPPITFQLTCEGQTVALPEPSDFPPLQGFAQAMDNLKSRNSDNEETMLSKIVPIECYHPKQRLGLLSLQCFAIRERQVQHISIEESFPISTKESSHHVALMRKPELIVKYIQGPGLPSSQIEYAGVFIVEEEVDRVFAQSEPPTHDDWSYQSLEAPREKTFVRTAYKRIQEALQDFTSPPPISNKGTGILPLGGFADRLGGLLLGAEGSGAAIQPFSDRNSVSSTISGEDRDRIKGKTGTESGKPSKSMVKEQTSARYHSTQKAKVALLKKPMLDFIDNMPALLADFVVEHASNSQATEVHVEVSAVLDGNEVEKDPPTGVRVPQVLQWISPDGIQYQGSPQIVIPTTSSGVWKVAVSVPDDVVVGMNLKASEVW